MDEASFQQMMSEVEPGADSGGGPGASVPAVAPAGATANPAPEAPKNGG